MIYTVARFTNSDGTMVTGTDADGNTETRSIDNPHEYRREDEFITGFLAGGGEIEPFALSTADNITSAPSDLFGGPTLKEIFNGH